MIKIIRYHLDSKIAIKLININLSAISVGKQTLQCECGNKRIIFHHEKYYELDGHDEVHAICKKCHYKKGTYYNKYNLNIYDFHKISRKANIRLYKTLIKYLGTNYRERLWVNPYENLEFEE